jgi:hypothetical protein
LSSTTLRWAWEQKVPAHLKLMLVLLGDEAGSEDGVCWASYEHLARKTGGSRRNAIRQVKELVELGKVATVPVPGGANAFVVQCPDCPALGDLARMETKRRRRRRAGGDNLTPQAEGGDTQGSEPAARGDANDTPAAGEGVTPRVAGGDTGDTEGVTPRVTGGDTGGTQTLQGTTQDPPIERTASAETLTRSTPPESHSGRGHQHNVECDCHPVPLRPRINGEGDISTPVVLVPLVDSGGRPYAITQKLLGELSQTYPGVNAEQTARNIRQWALANPRNRKTPSGVQRFITNWFAREQNKARTGGAASITEPAPFSVRRVGQ